MTEEMEQQIDKYWNEKKHDKIVEIIMEVPKEERDLDMLGQLVVAYNNLERYEDAVALSLELKEESKESISWYYRIGYAMLHMGEYKKAEEYLSKGIELVNKQNAVNWLFDLKCLYDKCLARLYTGELWKEEPLEIIWLEEEKKYIVSKGSIELGYFGKFYACQMDVGFYEYDYKDLFSKNENYDFGALKNYLAENMSHEEIAKGLTEFFNHRLEDIKKHIIEINQAFLAHVLDDVIGGGIHFWEDCTSYVISDKMRQEETGNMERAIYTNEVTENFTELFMEKYYEKAMNGVVDTTTYIEDFLEQKMPMFDYKKMLKDIYAEYMCLGVNGILAQCSGEGEALELVCSACADIQNDNSFFDWHNH